ncbi:MAG: hypothetical protein K0U36_03400 [Alphaproteobacteria bacterium]|nr:hypothetical protein [Alphaproteobacteria bacterium]
MTDASSRPASPPDESQGDRSRAVRSPDFGQQYLLGSKYYDDIFGPHILQPTWQRRGTLRLHLYFLLWRLCRPLVRRPRKHKAPKTFVFMFEGPLGDSCITMGVFHTLRQSPAFAGHRFIGVAISENKVRLSTKLRLSYPFRWKAFQKKVQAGETIIAQLASLFAMEVIYVHRKKFLLNPLYRLAITIGLYRLAATHIYVPGAVRNVFFYDALALCAQPQRILAQKFSPRTPPYFVQTASKQFLQRRLLYQYTQKAEDILARRMEPSVTPLDHSDWRSPIEADWFGVNPHTIDDVFAVLEANAMRPSLPLQTIAPPRSDYVLPQNSYIVLGIGTTVNWKSWSPFSWLDVIKSLLHNFDHDLVLTCSRKHYDSVRNISTQLDEESLSRIHLAFELASIVDFASLIGHAALSISEDTGHAHIAYAVGTPQLTILSDFHDNLRYLFGIFIPYPAYYVPMTKQGYVKLVFEQYHHLSHRHFRATVLPLFAEGARKLLDGQPCGYLGVHPHDIEDAPLATSANA